MKQLRTLGFLLAWVGCGLALVDCGPTLTLYHQANAAVWSPDSSVIATAGEEGTIRIWDPGTGSVRLTLNSPGPVRSLVWSPDGHSIVAVSADHTVRVWDAHTGQLRAPFGFVH